MKDLTVSRCFSERFQHYYYAVEDADGWCVCVYLEDEKELAEEHARTGKHQHPPATPLAQGAINWSAS
jgi:hypothetical protein